MSFFYFIRKIESFRPSINDINILLDDKTVRKYIKNFRNPKYNKALTNNVIKYFNAPKTSDGKVMIDGKLVDPYPGHMCNATVKYKYDFIYLELFWMIYAADNIGLWLKLADISSDFIKYYYDKKKENIFDIYYVSYEHSLNISREIMDIKQDHDIIFNYDVIQEEIDEYGASITFDYTLFKKNITKKNDFFKNKLYFYDDI